PFRRSLPLTLAFAATADRLTAVLTGPVTVAGSRATPIRRSRSADTSGMVRVSVQCHPLTASAALVWSGDLPRPLQQVLFETADSLTTPPSPPPHEVASLTTPKSSGRASWAVSGLLVPASVGEHQRAPAVDRVADVGDVGGGDDPGRGELDRLQVVQAEAGAEQAHPVTKDHRRDVQLQLVQQPEPDHLAEQGAAAGDCHVLPLRGRPGLADGAFDAVGDIGEAGAALPVQGRPGPVGDHEH